MVDIAKIQLFSKNDRKILPHGAWRVVLRAVGWCGLSGKAAKGRPSGVCPWNSVGWERGLV